MLEKSDLGDLAQRLSISSIRLAHHLTEGSISLLRMDDLKKILRFLKDNAGRLGFEEFRRLRIDGNKSQLAQRIGSIFPGAVTTMLSRSTAVLTQPAHPPPPPLTASFDKSIFVNLLKENPSFDLKDILGLAKSSFFLFA